MDAIEELENEPDASRLIFGLRDTGYNILTAAADIVDNSLAANAKVINIEIELRRTGHRFVYFGDDGDGMTPEELTNAMRYGAKPRENLKSLGKFGLGLKTASSSICKRYSLISRKTENDPLAKLTWDLDYVKANDKWMMIKEPVTPAERAKFDELCGATGTLLIWSNCDRLLNKQYQEPGGTQERQAINRLANKLNEHIGTVFHRFLDDNDNRERNANIFLNGQRVEPWNPFFPSRSQQVMLPDAQTIEVELMDGSIEKAQMRAWILPHSADCSEAEKLIAKHSNSRQGFYVYRENRLIHTGGWLGIHGWSSLEPHLTLLRIEFDFGYLLDETFSVDVKKSRILLDPALEEHVIKVLSPIRREADRLYRRKNSSLINTKVIDHGASNNRIASTSNTKKPAVTAVSGDGKSAVVSNNRGSAITLKLPVQNNVDPAKLHIDPTEDITSGLLWEPCLRSASDESHAVGVRINKNHDFYQKIYARSKANGYSIEGMDLLLWAIAAAEENNNDERLQPIFEDFREEISSNLRKLLRDVPLPDVNSQLTENGSLDESESD